MCIRDRLKKGSEALGLSSTFEQLKNQAKYLDLLLEANKKINLTGIREPKAAVIKHTLDSLSASSAIEGVKIIDIGSGGGTPGIPLAIALPEKKFYLIEATQKKASFLNEVVRALKLDNVEVICERGESVTNLSADTVIARAFGTLNYLVTTSRNMVPKGGLFLAMKGKINPDEIKGLISGFRVLQIQEIEVPYLEATRHFVFIKRK